MKRILCALLCLMIILPVTAFAAQSKLNPVSLMEYSDLPETIEGQHHYLLLCVDQWHGKPKNLGNTDGIVIVTVDTRAHRVMLTSVIRDALVQKPEGTIGRINYIAKNYSPEQLCKTLSQHLGFKLEKYILFDFSQISNIIDYLGGVDITISSAEASYLTRYAISKTSTSPSVTGAGTYRFYGHASVIYMRIRKAGGGGDFMRTQRVRTVLSTLADQCRSITYDDARHLVDSIMENTTLTNMTLEDMVEAMELAFSLRDCTIEELRIPIEGTYHSVTHANMAVQELDWEANRAAMSNYLNSSFLVLDEEDEEELN